MDKNELVITALQQRIGEIVSQYESQSAWLRAEITQLIEKNKEKEDSVSEYAEVFNKKCDSEQLLLKEIESLKVHIKITEKTNENLKKAVEKPTRASKKS